MSVIKFVLLLYLLVKTDATPAPGSINNCVDLYFPTSYQLINNQPVQTLNTDFEPILYGKTLCKPTFIISLKCQLSVTRSFPRFYGIVHDVDFFLFKTFSSNILQ